MRVVKVEGDGDCLFHALAYFESGDGGALRIDVADFLEAHALEQDGFEETWLSEAEELRASAWGGHNAIIAYSLMKNTRVILHTHHNGAVETTVAEQSHGLVIDCDEAPVLHILYNGVNHYDALVPLVTAADREGLKPAWENQPFPNTYLWKPTSKRVAQASAETENGKPKRRRFNAPRPKPVGKKNKPKDKHETPAPVTRHRRYTCKTTPPPELRDDIMTEMAKVPVTAAGTLHPHRKIEDMIKAGTPTFILHELCKVLWLVTRPAYLCMYATFARSFLLYPQPSLFLLTLLHLCQELAVGKLRRHPTVPPEAELTDADAGRLWPKAFCTFLGCAWISQEGDEEALHEHLLQEHSVDLEPIREEMLLTAGTAPDAILSIYNQAVAHQCRADAPVAGCSIDRRALHTFSHACEADGIEALICFCCGRIYTHLADIPPEQQDIQWLQPLEEDPHNAGRFTFLGQPAPDIANLLGLDTYLRRYDNGQRRLTSFETFDEWCVHLPMHAEDTDPKKLLCNPEDFLCQCFLLDL